MIRVLLTLNGPVGDSRLDCAAVKIFPYFYYCLTGCETVPEGIFDENTIDDLKVSLSPMCVLREV